MCNNFKQEKIDSIIKLESAITIFRTVDFPENGITMGYELKIENNPYQYVILRLELKINYDDLG